MIIDSADHKACFKTVDKGGFFTDNYVVIGNHEMPQDDDITRGANLRCTGIVKFTEGTVHLPSSRTYLDGMEINYTVRYQEAGREIVETRTLDLQETYDRITTLEDENKELKKRIARLEKLVQHFTAI